MVGLALYLYICLISASLGTVRMVRPINRIDIISALFFPFLFPYYLTIGLFKKD